MTMADVFGITLVCVGLILVLPAHWLLFGALWPAALDRARRRIPGSPVATFFTGLGVSAALSAVAGIAGALNAAPLAFIILAFGFAWSSLGISALARHVGERLSSPGEAPWKGHLRGGIALVLSFLVPLVGWFLILPISLVLGTGAATLSLFRRQEQPTPAPAPVREEAEMLA